MEVEERTQATQVSCAAEVSQSSWSTQQPQLDSTWPIGLPWLASRHSELSQELDVPEEDCDDATEEELQKRLEDLRCKEGTGS